MLELSDCSAELFETEGQTIRFALAVSSSSVTNITPFADTGIWRTSTSPASERRLPPAGAASARHGTKFDIHQFPTRGPSLSQGALSPRQQLGRGMHPIRRRCI
jgi:hypothetical protein